MVKIFKIKTRGRKKKKTKTKQNYQETRIFCLAAGGLES